jgi:hypothetical protein
VPLAILHQWQVSTLVLVVDTEHRLARAKAVAPQRERVQPVTLDDSVLVVNTVAKNIYILKSNKPQKVLVQAERADGVSVVVWVLSLVLARLFV